MFTIRGIIRYAKPTPQAPAPVIKRRLADGGLNPEYTKERRRKAAQAGLCSACGSPKPDRRPREGNRKCDVCIAPDTAAGKRSTK